MAIRALLSTVSLLLIAGSIVMMFFVVLSGVKDTTPLNKTYFLRVADSSAFSSRPVSQWTYFYVCGDGNTDCGAAVPALPVGYAWLGQSSAVPASLTGSHAKGTTSTYFFYMWRFGWVFYLIALVLDVAAFFLGFLGYIGRLGSGLSGLVVGSAAFFMAIAVSLMTAEFVRMRNRFNDNGFDASLGRYAFGFSWAAFTCMGIATILFFLGIIPGSRDNTYATGGRRSYFRRRQHNPRLSTVDNESQHRVKEEYS